ncbi:MAG TPA: FHA domain-containing protein [Polyangiaceae bacterium]|nr:FHA domain-containing protein [Polyangiaceae bacterium]
MTGRLARCLLISAISLLCFVLGRDASATPEAHILRIDPRTGLKDGKPILTTVIEVVQFKRLSDALQPCAGATGAATLSCWSDQLEKPAALWEPFPFPEQNAHLLVKVSGEDQLTKFIDKVQWGKTKGPNVGTAWLVAIDAASGMGARFGDARAIAHELIEQMQPNDLMDLMFFDDVQVVRDTKWKAFKQRAELGNALNDFKSTSVSHGRDRALFSQIKGMTQDAFGSLGNSDQPDTVPLHQAMVVLSNGAGRGDPESASPSADIFHQYLDRGRFPEDNTALPKTPLPVISIWLPNPGSLAENIYRNNEAQFMQSLANPEIGGFFDIVQEGQGDRKAKTIIGLVRARFNAMWLIHWTMSCINPSVEQTFNLVFENTHPAIAPDGTFKDVPIGMDPTQWPLDVDVPKTVKAAQEAPLYPGGQFSVYGDFCWSGDRQRAEAYFIPAGTTPSVQASTRDPEMAKKVMQQLQAEHMLGTAIATGDGYATFAVPDDDKVLEGAGDNMVARLVVYDNKAHRASAVDDKSILTLKATKKPLSIPLITGIAGLLIVIVLLMLVLLRAGGGRRRGGGTPPAVTPQPPAYGAAPGSGYGVGPPGAGYGAPAPPADAHAATAALPGVVPTAELPPGYPPPHATPPPAAPPATPPPPPPVGAVAGTGGRDTGAIAAQPGPPILQVRCPACGMSTMATPGQPSVCFSCGQPLPSEAIKGGPSAPAAFPPTSAFSAQPLVPPPNPYAAAPGARASVSAATLRGSAGQFTIRSGSEVRVGRDPAQCPIFLGEPRVSGVHATLKLDGSLLVVRDESSNNGTWVSGLRIAPGVWTPVSSGTPLRFGPLEFTVQFEA